MCYNLDYLFHKLKVKIFLKIYFWIQESMLKYIYCSEQEKFGN